MDYGEGEAQLMLQENSIITIYNGIRKKNSSIGSISSNQ